ncbi:MAG TPA: hypothetical protein VK858_11060, partial [Longimicrobiales bacterium]|nr:hypothetical protein [Longimicrobiales bacterium]
MTDSIPSDPPGTPSDPAFDPGAADPPSPADPLDPDALETSLELRLLAPLGTVVQGQPQVLRQVAVTLLARGHALLEG